MSVPNRQIGSSSESNLLWQIAKQLEKLIKVVANSPLEYLISLKLDKNFSSLPTASLPLSSSDTLVVNQSGVPKEVAVSDLGGAVDSVNGQTGVVVLDATDVSALSNDVADYTTATTPLAGTEIALVEQGGTFKKVAVSEFGGSGAIKRTFTIAFSGGVYYDTTSILNWSGMAVNGTSSLGLNGHTNGLLFIYNAGSSGLPSALSSARVIPYDCKIKSIAVRNSSSPFSAINPSAFRLRFYTHTPSGTSTLNNAVLQAEFNSTGYLMLQNYTYPDLCITNNGLTLQKGDVFTIIHKKEQTLPGNTAVHDILIEFEEEI